MGLNVKPGTRVGEPCALTLKPMVTCVVISNRTETMATGKRRDISLFRPLGGNVTFVTGAMPLGDEGRDEDVTVHDPAGLFAVLFSEALARHGILVIAEGIETVEQRDVMVECGCDLLQGFLFGRPIVEGL
jgi:hypothetical protein